MGSIFRKLKVSAIIFFGIEVNAKGKHSVCVGRRQIVSMRLEKILSLGLITTNQKLIQTKPLKPICLFNLGGKAPDYALPEFTR